MVRKYQEAYAKHKAQRNKLWWYLILLSPFFAFSLFILYFCLLAFVRAFPEMVFGHGSEVFLVSPIAVFCVALGIVLVRKLLRTKLVSHE